MLYCFLQASLQTRQAACFPILEPRLAKQICISHKRQSHQHLPSAQATMSALGAGPNCAIFSDELNHASIVDGARLAKSSGASLHVYRHNDMSHLAQLLEQLPRDKRKLVVTDSLFSMDGKAAGLPDSPTTPPCRPAFAVFST